MVYCLHFLHKLCNKLWTSSATTSETALAVTCPKGYVGLLAFCSTSR